MNRKSLSALSCAAALALSLGASAAQAAGTADGEYAQIFMKGNILNLTRVPTKDVNGNVQYFDVQLTLPILDTGLPSSKATVKATLSPVFTGNAFIPGTYSSPTFDGGTGITCSLKTGQLNGGRQSVLLVCTEGNAAKYGMTTIQLASGDILGHPFQNIFLNSGIDKVADYKDFTWGDITEFSFKGINPGCFSNRSGSSGIVNARQDGNNLEILLYGSANTPLCGITLTLVP